MMKWNAEFHLNATGGIVCLMLKKSVKSTLSHFLVKEHLGKGTKQRIFVFFSNHWQGKVYGVSNVYGFITEVKNINLPYYILWTNHVPRMEKYWLSESYRSLNSLLEINTMD